ncbi:MAG: cation:proton antiporter [Deltaproteobacteria bacterium]|nr:cation:proton antiporter [Deltaproteobacteria bacterium]
MVLSESDYGHQALSDIIPLRDLFGLLFFTSAGMLFDPAFMLDNIRQVIFLVMAVCIGKGLIFALISRLFNYRNVIPLAVGLGLFQIGEFSFVRPGWGCRSIPSAMTFTPWYRPAAILTASVLTPLVSGQTTRLYADKKRWFRHVEVLESSNIPDEGYTGHVVIIGGGRWASRSRRYSSGWISGLSSSNSTTGVFQEAGKPDGCCLWRCRPGDCS